MRCIEHQGSLWYPVVILLMNHEFGATFAVAALMQQDDVSCTDGGGCIGWTYQCAGMDDAISSEAISMCCSLAQLVNPSGPVTECEQGF
jgi:hypothetical protein